MEEGWRWSQWVTLFLGLGVYIFVLPQRETYKKIIIKRRAKKLGLPTPTGPVQSPGAKLRFFLSVTVFRPIRLTFSEPIVALLSVYTAFNFAILFSFFAAFPVIYESAVPSIQIYHFNPGEEGLVFLAIGLGTTVGAFVCVLIDKKVYRRQFAAQLALGDKTPPPPEKRLSAPILWSVLLPIGLYWFAWTALGHPLDLIDFGHDSVLRR